MPSSRVHLTVKIEVEEFDGACEHIQNSIYDTLDEIGVDYRVEEVSISEDQALKPDENHIGGFKANGSDTSRNGAIDAYPRSGSQRWKALLCIAKSPNGMTYMEVEHATGVRGIWKRISELKEGEWVEANGERFIPETASLGDIYFATDKAVRYITEKEFGTMTGIQ